MQPTRVAVLVCGVLVLTAGSRAAITAQAEAPDRWEEALGALARSAGASAPAKVDAAGLTPSGKRLWAVEPLAGTDATRPRLVLIGGLDGDPASAEVVLSILRWWFTEPRRVAPLTAWDIAAIPCARPERCGGSSAGSSDAPLSFPPTGGFFDGKQDPTAHYIWRWTTMQAPTLVVEIRAGAATTVEANALAAALVTDPRPPGEGSLASALGKSGAGPAWSRPAPALRLGVSGAAAVAAIRDVLSGAAMLSSPVAETLTARQSRMPLDVARLLAPKYPAQPIMSYIPALSWAGALRLAAVTGEPRFRDKPLADLAPFLSGDKPSIAEPYLLTSLAGHLALSDVGAVDGNVAAAALAQKAADFILPQEADALVRFPRAWTDDMFMAVSVLARVAARTEAARYADAAGRLLTTYADTLQRPDGLFMHAAEGPYAWGRGNGFAAFGLMEALTFLPVSWPERPRVLRSYQALMKALLAHQAADGMWRQVVDEPGSYRELTVTAMTLTAMARGLRLGWLDTSYRVPIDRAWRGLLARIAEDGTLMDVCTGTGSGPTRQYYLDRAAITGADDRGGAMALTAALEMEDVNRSTRR